MSASILAAHSAVVAATAPTAGAAAPTTASGLIIAGISLPQLLTIAAAIAALLTVLFLAYRGYTSYVKLPIR